MPEGEPQPQSSPSFEDLALVRHGFINDVYPQLFGSDFDSDTTVEITSLNVTSLLMQYEAQLVKDGLIKLAQSSNG